LRELLVCFVSFTSGLFLSIIVFVLEIFFIHSFPSFFFIFQIIRKFFSKLMHSETLKLN
jgi:hypothetical protein